MISVSVRDISKRKAVDEKLKKSEENFKLLVNSVKDYAIYMVDLSGSVVSWNEGAARIKGYTAAEIIGQSIDVFYTQQEKNNAEPQNNLRLARQNGHFETNGWRLRQGGIPFYANIVFTALFDTDGNLYGYAKVTKDITEKRNVEEQLRLLASIATNIHDPIIVSDKNFIVTRWNKAAENLLEWTSEEVIGKNAMDILNVSYSSEAKEQILEALTEKEYWKGEVIYHSKSGIPFTVLATVSHLKDENGNITGNLILVRDITDRKKSEAALTTLNEELEQRVKDRTQEIYNNEKKFRALVENNEAIITMMDDNFKTFYVSPYSQRITGWGNDEMKEKELWLHYHPDHSDYVEDLMKNVLQNPGKSFELTILSRHKDGHYIWLEGAITNLLSDASVGAIVTNLRDITIQKEIKQKIKNINIELEEKVQLRSAELIAANEEMEAFTYSVSHDLRAPVRGIIGFTSILEEEFSNRLGKEARRITSVIKNNAIKMGSLIDDLLHFSKTGKQELLKVKINSETMVTDIIRDAALELSNPAIKWEIKNLPQVMGDITTLRQVWINLLSNAIKYSRKKIEPVIEVGYYPDDQSTVFFVKDNGVGFDEKYKHKLFKIFQRLHSNDEFEGTGVGLALVEKIVSRHGGRVWAESKKESGACFFFSLPET